MVNEDTDRVPLTDATDIDRALDSLSTEEKLTPLIDVEQKDDFQYMLLYCAEIAGKYAEAYPYGDNGPEPQHIWIAVEVLNEKIVRQPFCDMRSVALWIADTIERCRRRSLLPGDFEGQRQNRATMSVIREFTENVFPGWDLSIEWLRAWREK